MLLKQVLLHNRKYALVWMQMQCKYKNHKLKQEKTKTNKIAPYAICAIKSQLLFLINDENSLFEEKKVHFQMSFSQRKQETYKMRSVN